MILSDNTQTVAFINRGTTKNIAALHWLIAVFYRSVMHGFRVAAVYSVGVQKVLADSLSRLTQGKHYKKRFLTLFELILFRAQVYPLRLFAATRGWLKGQHEQKAELNLLRSQALAPVLSEPEHRSD